MIRVEVYDDTSPKQIDKLSYQVWGSYIITKSTGSVSYIV